MALLTYTHTHVTITSVAMDTLRLPVVDLHTKILDAQLPVELSFIFMQFLGKFGQIVG